MVLPSSIWLLCLWTGSSIMEIEMQSTTQSISNTADDSGYLSHSCVSLPSSGPTKTSHRHSWRSCSRSPQPFNSISPNDSGVPASPTFEIQRTLSLYDDFEDSLLSGISEPHDGLPHTLRKSEAVNEDSRNFFDSGTLEISMPFLKPVTGPLNTKRKCSSTVTSTERISSPKRKTYPAHFAKYFLSNGEQGRPTAKYIYDITTPTVSFAGKSYVDFLYELGEKMCFTPVVSKIFSYLSSEDLCSVSLVSPTWHKVVCRDRTSNKRRRQYIRIKKINLENTHLMNRAKQTQFSSRNQYSSGSGVLSQVQKLSIRRTSTPCSPPVSPTKVRFHLFYKEGCKLASGKQLVRCPRCSLPAHLDASLGRGVCSRKGCQFEFCTHCYCDFHEGTPCGTTLLPIYQTSKTGGGVVGSKRSRRNLHKLLL